MGDDSLLEALKKASQDGMQFKSSKQVFEHIKVSVYGTRGKLTSHRAFHRSLTSNAAVSAAVGELTRHYEDSLLAHPSLQVISSASGSVEIPLRCS